MSDINSDQIEKEIKRIVQEELEDYFRMSRPGFSISSGHQTTGHGKAEFCMTTDSVQGMHFYKQGNVKMKANKSFELYSGNDIRSVEMDRFSIVLNAETGHVKIKANQGNITLEGNDIKLIASDTLLLHGDRIAKVEGPSVQVEGETVSTVGILEVKNLAGSLEQHSESSGAETSGGEDNAANTDLISRIINLIDEIEKLLVFAA